MPIISGLKVAAATIGNSATDTQNFQISANNDGTMKIARKSDGSGGDILTVDAAGVVTAPAGLVTGRMVLATAQNTTSGTSIDFTGIPSWAKRITVMLNGVSTSGTSPFLIQIGSGSIVTVGYQSSGSGVAGTVGTTTSIIGFVIGNVNIATSLHDGQAILSLLSTNTWVGNGAFYVQGNTQTNLTAGVSPALAGVLDRIRLTTVNGTDTFDAGSVNILYEG